MQRVSTSEEPGVYNVRLTIQEMYLIRDALGTERADLLRSITASRKTKTPASPKAEARVYELKDVQQIFADHISKRG